LAEIVEPWLMRQLGVEPNHLGPGGRVTGTGSDH
jgi:hypothetical protein